GGNAPRPGRGRQPRWHRGGRDAGALRRAQLRHPARADDALDAAPALGTLKAPAAGAASTLGVLLPAALLYPRGMGMGDVKLAAVMGLFLGASVIPALFVGIALGALVGFALILRFGPAARKHAVPFGPFLAIGGVVGLLAGGQMIDAY